MFHITTAPRDIDTLGARTALMDDGETRLFHVYCGVFAPERETLSEEDYIEATMIGKDMELTEGQSICQLCQILKLKTQLSWERNERS